MPAEPFSWNVVIVGSWNPAILSPDGISRRLFQLPQGTPVELEMAVDRPGQFRVGYQGILVVPSSISLEIAARVPDRNSLLRACDLGKRALETLPETPVSAAGMNIRYQFAEVPDRIFDLVKAPLDAALSDAGFAVRGALTKRGIEIEPGMLNLQITEARGGVPAGTLEFNFHRDSSVPEELRQWLARGEEFIGLSNNVIDAMGVNDAIRREVHA